MTIFATIIRLSVSHEEARNAALVLGLPGRFPRRHSLAVDLLDVLPDIVAAFLDLHPRARLVRVHFGEDECAAFCGFEFLDRFLCTCSGVCGAVCVVCVLVIVG